MIVRAARSAVLALLLISGLLSPVRPVRSADAPATAPRPSAAADPVLRAAASGYEDIRTEVLPNGLKVYLKPIPGAPTVTTMVAYKVGSADEDATSTGLAHYLEHLMFKGTEKIMPGDIDRMTQRNGGANNAYTSEDMTVYHFDFAADRWEGALAIEADRMRNIRIDEKHEFQGEKQVVVEELQRNEDTPYDLEQKMIVPLLFGTGPYGHPVIGEREHVFAATPAIIKGYYDRWYHPNNASLVIVGGFDADKALAKVKELFGPIPAGKLPERRVATATKRDGPVAKTFTSKFDAARMIMGYNGVSMDDKDLYALEVIQGILSTGKTGRLYKALVEGAQIANEVSAFDSAGRYPGWFGVQLELLKGKDRNEAEKLVLAELKKLADEPVSDAELTRVRRGLLSGAVFGRESVHNLANNIATTVTTNDLDYLRNYLGRLMAVSAADVQAAARKYLNPQQRVTIWSVPKEGGAGGKADKEGKDEKKPQRRAARLAEGAKPAGAAGSFSLASAKRVVLDNGLVLLMFENHRLPILTASAFVRDVKAAEDKDKAGVAALTGSLLEEGTAKHTGPQISELIEGVGGSLSTTSSGATVQVLSPDRSLGLGLLFECLLTPTFPEDAFAREKERALSDIDDAETQPDTKAQRVYREMLYGDHHYGRPGRGYRKTVEKLTRADCAAFHKENFLPGNTVLAVVGDFDSAELVKEIKALTADWKAHPAKGAAKRELAIPADAKFVQHVVQMPEAVQVALYMGHLGIERRDPDYYKLLVLDNVLGTGPGFTDRLSARLRDREGLAYTVRATIASGADDERGLFTCYAGVDPKNFAKAKAGFLEELAKIRAEAPTAQEVDDAKAYLIGSLPFKFSTNSDIAGQLLTIEHYKLGFDYFDDYRKAVAAVTPADVLAAAKKHLHPDKLLLVAAGALDADGKPLKKAEK